MSSDRQQFRYALEQWRTYQAEGRVSCPAQQGRVAIVCSYSIGEKPEEFVRKRQPKDIRIFRKEAFAMADMVAESGFMPEIVLNASSSDMGAILADPAIATICTIGHGCLSAIQLSDIEYDWYDVYRQADHLKTGQFVQRQCGIFSRDFNAPLGLFAVSDPTNVIAATGIPFEPRGLLDETNDFLQQVFSEGNISYRAIKNTLTYGS